MYGVGRMDLNRQVSVVKLAESFETLYLLGSRRGRNAGVAGHGHGGVDTNRDGRYIVAIAHYPQQSLT